MILPIFDYCDVAWDECGKVNSDALESSQRRAVKLIFPNSGLDTKELNTSLGPAPLINRRKLHIVCNYKKKMPRRFSSPYSNNYFNSNASVHSVYH